MFAEGDIFAAERVIRQFLLTRPDHIEGMRLLAQVGAHWPATYDLASAWGIVRLVHEDPAQLDRDAEAVHGLMRLRVT